MVELKKIRKEARSDLSSKFSKYAKLTLGCILFNAILAIFVFALSYFFLDIINVVTILMSLIIIIIGIPIGYGVMVSIIKIKRKGEIGLFEFVKIAVNNFGKIWSLTLGYIFRMIVPVSLLLILNLMIIYYITYEFIKLFYIATSIYGLMILTGGIILFLNLIALFIVKNLNYVYIYNLYYDKSNLKNKVILDTCKESMNGLKGKYFLLILSFMPYEIIIGLIYFILNLSSRVSSGIVSIIVSFICIICVSILQLILILYTNISKVCFYDNLIKDNIEEK